MNIMATIAIIVGVLVLVVLVDEVNRARKDRFHAWDRHERALSAHVSALCLEIQQMRAQADDQRELDRLAHRGDLDVVIEACERVGRSLLEQRERHFEQEQRAREQVAALGVTVLPGDETRAMIGLLQQFHAELEHQRDQRERHHQLTKNLKGPIG